MDITTVLGLLLALCIILFPLVGGYESFIVPEGLLFVLGGTLGATILSVPRRSLVMAVGAIRVAFREKRRSARSLIESIVTMSEVARRDGILALEALIPQVEDDFLAKGVQLAVDGTDPDSLSTTLSQDLAQTRHRHRAGSFVLEVIARYAPAFGMLGTLAGLILMLSTPSESDVHGSAREILPKMAFALVTTFYGLFIANALAFPLAEKLSQKDQEEARYKQIVINGILAIQNGDNPGIVAEKLNVFLAPDERAE